MPSRLNQGRNHSQVDVLLAVIGISPAVLTETLWALAHEQPPVIPEYVVVLTTRPGRLEIERVLFQEGGWSRFLNALERERLGINNRLRFGPASDYIRLFPRADGMDDLDDIVTAEDSKAAADFTMRVLRELTEDPTTRVIASIAGGRKTMGALLTSCMILLGRNQDRLCHVLVNHPYDSSALIPLFLFPEIGQLHRLPGRSKGFPLNSAKIDLIDIPFVRVRGWYEREHRQTPPGYMALVRHVQGLIPEVASFPQITVDLRSGILLIDKSPVAMSSAEFALFSIIARRAAEGQPIQSWAAIKDEILQLQHRSNVPAQAVWLHDFREKKFELKEDARKLAAAIRKKVRQHIPDVTIASRLVPSLKSKLYKTYPPGKIKIHGFDDDT